MGAHELEQLETRQLLFTLTVGSGSVDPNTGLGTVGGQFSYVIPRLGPITPAMVQGTDVTENFDDEMAGWTTQVPPAPPSGTFFAQSNIQISYSSVATAPVQLVRRQIAPNTFDNGMRVALSTTDQATFTFHEPQNQGAPVQRLVRRAVFTVTNGTDGNALNTDAVNGTRLELLSNGVVVATLRGTALANLGVPVFLPTGVGTRFTVDFGDGFDSFRFSAAANPGSPEAATYADNFVIEDISTTIPGGEYAADIIARTFEFHFSFTGPAGSSIQFLDLYGRDIVNVRNQIPQQGSMISPLDRNDDGVPDRNDGIGRIIITGANGNSSFSVLGSKPVLNGPNEFPNDALGFFDDFENAGDLGFGFTVGGDPANPEALGLPPGQGSTLIGSTIVRPNTSPAAYRSHNPGTATQDDFNRTDQGILINGSMGSINVHGAMFGSTTVTGALQRFSVGAMFGSLRVDGDLGLFSSAGDAGIWVSEENLDTVIGTGSRLTVGRTVREVMTGGRYGMNTSVLADINNTSRAKINFVDYVSRERVMGFNTALSQTVVLTENYLNRGVTFSNQALPFGAGYFRNDSIESAEYVGYNGTRVRIFGQLNGQDPANTAPDANDVYAFPADPSRELVVSLGPGLAGAYVRIVDHEGRVIAATDRGLPGRGPNGNNNFVNPSQLLRFRPDVAGVYYLVINVPGNGPGVGASYDATISGMTPVTFGSLRAASGAGSEQLPMTVSLSAGSMGLLSIGNGLFTNDGGLTIGNVINTDQGADQLGAWGRSTVNVPGSMLAVRTGFDVNGATLTVGGNLGMFSTGNAAPSVLNGDLYNADIRVGGRIGTLDIKGALAANQIPAPTVDARNGIVRIVTGTTPGQRGDIGQILVGAYVAGPGVTIRTSSGSQIDQFLVGTNNDGAGSEFPGQITDGQPTITTGIGSDVRFMDFRQINDGNNGDATFVLNIGDAPIRFTDDAGAEFTIGISGGATNPPGTPAGTPQPTFGSQLIIRVLPVNSGVSGGVVVASIQAVLRGGANLVINGLTSGVVSIGRIIVDSQFGDGGTAPQPQVNNSNIIIQGNTEIDIGRIDQEAGTLASIQNLTTGGDIVAIDAASLKRITIFGNLGRTQTSGAGPSLLGRFLGVGANGGTDSVVYGPLLVAETSVNNWNGDMFAPIAFPSFMTPTSIEMLGSPIDGYLNGAVVRSGDLFDVQVRGTVGDVLVQNGHLINLRANSDGFTPQGGFEGIEGSLYAVAIGTVDIGDGLKGTGAGPFALAGIFADSGIVRVVGNRPSNTIIQGVILADSEFSINAIGTENPTALGFDLDGIGSVSLTNGRYDTAFIAAMALDDFWLSSMVNDPAASTGSIGTVSATNADFFRSSVQGFALQAMTIVQGAFDASFLNFSTNIGSVTADEFRNSTRLGDPTEIYTNRIRTTNNLGNISTNGLAGDISDLLLELGGSLTGAMTARNIARTTIVVDNNVNQVRATNDVRSVSIIAGALQNLTAGQSIRSSTLGIAGPIVLITAGNEITQLDVKSTGPDGMVGTIRATNLLQADVTSSGAITLIQSDTNDVQGSIETRNDPVRPRNGGLGTLSAGRDLLVSLIILGDTQAIFAGRNIGTHGVVNSPLDLRGNLGNLTTATGQNYSDLIVGQSITGTVTNGRVDMRPGRDQVSTASILVFGSINALVFNGDANGDIISRSGGIRNITFNSGSFRQGNDIVVNNGNLTQLTLNGGDLLGDVLVDGNIGRIDVLVGPDGFKGQIGIASWRRTSKRWQQDIRNELPPGANRSEAIDGVTIKAGGSIGTVFVERGSFTESQIIAGTTIDSVFVGLQLRNDALTKGLNNAIVAGDRINSVVVGKFVGAVAVLGGVVDLGADGRVGGIGANADTVKAGTVGQVLFQGPKAVNSVVAAGIAPDANGKYNTSTSLLAPGTSSVGQVFGNTIINVSAFADGPLGATSAGIVRGGNGLTQAQPDLIAPATGSINEIEMVSGVQFAFTTQNGENGVALFTGPGRVFWDPTINQIRLLNPTSASALTVTGQGNARLTNFLIRSNTNTSLGTLNVQATLRGNSIAYIDMGIGTMNLAGANSANGVFGSGGDIASINLGTFTAGSLRAARVNTFNVGGDFGTTSTIARAKFVEVNSVNVAGNLAGGIAADLSIPTVTAGTMNGGGVTAGNSITNVTTASMLNARVTARNSIGTVNVAGNATGSSIMGGVDLGDDADFGGSNFDADVVGSGSVGAVNIGGNFQKSDVTAGVSRGASGFVGLDDAQIAAGRSSIGSVAIGGLLTGSNLNSEQYRVISTGTIGNVTVGGTPFTAQGNFVVERRDAVASPVEVIDLTVSENSRVYTATITFNQPVDASTLSDAISIIELRNSGATTIGLAEGTDYTITYDKSKNAAIISFSTTVTERTLPQTAGVPGPGVYQIVLSAAILRGSTQDSRLDGDANGQGGDDWVRNTIVGDAGDKTTSGVPAGQSSINFYAAADLDQVLRTRPTVGSLPEINTSFTINGTIGDHPDADPDFFRVGGDVDVYRVTLRAGQILRLSEVRGVGLGVARGLYDTAGNQVGGGVSTALASDLPANSPINSGATGEQNILIRQTGTYYLVVAGQLDGVQIADVDAINNADPVPGAFGRYAFDITVVDDGDTGFISDSSSGTGAGIVYAPTPSVFAGLDGQFGTADDLASFTDGDWTFTLQRGTTSPGGADAVVRGTNSQGWVSERRSAPNGTFGTVNDRVAISINSSIGLPGSKGNPTEVAPDVDVFRLNNGQPLVPGTHVRATIRLTKLGSNIGLTPDAVFASGEFNTDPTLISNNAQFGLFELPAGTGFDNAKLVLAPSAFLPIGGQDAETISDGRNSYGYDTNGDFFIDFVIPGALGVTNAVPASYALFLQGTIRSDYTLEILQQGTRTLGTSSQNVFIETKGGIVDWLEAGEGVNSVLSAYSSSILGFQGQINGLDVDTYVLNNLVANLNAIFTAANVAVNIATNAATFSRQDFSTVFLAGNVEPSSFFGNQQFGASEAVDMLNVNKNDQAVVFASSLAELGFDPSQQGVDAFVQALSAAMARRIGELVGVRFETSETPSSGSISVMAANSPNLTGANLPFRFTDSNRFLAGLNDGVTDTIFFLGQQNSGQLMSKILSPRV